MPVFYTKIDIERTSLDLAILLIRHFVILVFLITFLIYLFTFIEDNEVQVNKFTLFLLHFIFKYFKERHGKNYKMIKNRTTYISKWHVAYVCLTKIT